MALWFPCPYFTPKKVSFIAQRSVKGIERKIVELICDHAGSRALKEIASDPTIGWDIPCDDVFNSAKKRINAKLKKTSWCLYRHDGIAKLKDLGRK
jgi:hypothetical protein